MDILFLSTWFPYPPDNGSKLRVAHLLRALARAHQVSLVSFAFGTARPDEADDLRALCREVHVVPADPFAVNRAGSLRTFLSVRPVASRPIEGMRRLVTDVMHANRFDVVIASTEMMADYALQAPPSTARILEEHNSMTRWMRERYAAQTDPLQQLRCWASWQKRRRYERRFYRHFDLITMVSEADHVTTVNSVGAQRVPVDVVPNGVDCSYNRSGLTKAHPRRLVYNGSLTYSANYDAMRWFLAESYPRIKARIPEVSLTITGSTRGVDLDALSLNDSVRLTGFVDDVRWPVSEAAVCVIPLRQGGGTRIKILEAMALGTPVVSTTKGAEGLAVADGEHLLLADDPEAFAMRTVELLQSPGLRERLAANARRLVEERYDWGQIGERFVSLVEEVAWEREGRQP